MLAINVPSGCIAVCIGHLDVLVAEVAPAVAALVQQHVRRPLLGVALALAHGGQEGLHPGTGAGRGGGGGGDEGEDEEGGQATGRHGSSDLT